MIKKLHNWSEAHLPALILLTLLTLLPGRLRAADGDTFSYTYEGQTLKYAIISEAEKTVSIYSPRGSVSGQLILPSLVSYNGDNYTLTSIGEDAFFACNSLISIEIPNSVTSIGISAFSHCSSLTSVTIPNSVTSIGIYAFHDCSGLTSVTLGSGVETIGDYAFYYTDLTGIEIPASVNLIGYCAFGNCSSLNDFKIADGTAQLEITNYCCPIKLFEVIKD